MSLTILVIDSAVAYRGSSRHSLLALPLGRSTVLGCLRGQLEHLETSRIMIVPEAVDDATYRETLSGLDQDRVRVVGAEELGRYADDCETSDFAMVVEPRFWPVRGYDVGEQDELTAYRGATHFVAVGAQDTESVRERVEQDPSGRVRRVRRRYDSVNWPEAATTTIAYSVIPGEALSLARSGLMSLVALRSAASAAGLLSRDVPLRSPVFNLTRERDYLALNERELLKRHPRRLAGAGPDGDGEVIVGSGCTIHPTSRIVPPVVVQQNATLGAHVVVVGPAVVGPGSRVGAAAQVVQAVVDGAVTVPEGTVVRHRALLRGQTAGNGDPGHHEPESPDFPELFSLAASEDAARGGGESNGAGRRAQVAVKRVMDAVLASLALVVLLPFLAVVAVLIRLNSAGPIFFAHRREGMNSREFACWKFRTMVADAHLLQRDLYENNEVDGPQFKLQNDPRITRVGRWLRATNIDELPQLINVVLGDMSLVGPRPSPFRENQICVPWRRARLSVRPGITGLWQVCRNQDRSQGDFHEWIFYDVQYVRHFSLWLDLKILAATVLTLGGKWSVPMPSMIRRDSRQRGWIGVT